VRRQFVTLAWFRIAPLALLGGCLLVDYEVDRPTGQRTADGDDQVASDEADFNSRAGNQRGRDASADASEDPSLVVDLPGAAPGEEAAAQVTNRDDAGSAANGLAACPGQAANACGGCGVLSAMVGAACGECGVGRYECEGTEAVRCAGDAPPMSAGGKVLIDDFEDGDQYVRAENGLSGGWYTTADATLGLLNPAPGSQITPTAPGALGSARSVRMFGGGFMDWGVGLAVSLNAHGCSYNAMAQEGIAFYAKGQGLLTVSVATRQTVPLADGGTCFTSCYDNFSTSFALSDEWRLHIVPWSSLRQAGWGMPAFLSPRELRYLQFGFGPGTAFELQVDDLSFY
jgi:hypothetical protein